MVIAARVFVLSLILLGLGTNAVAAVAATATADDVLETLHAAGKNLRSFSADVKHTDSDDVNNSTVTNAGSLLYENQVSRGARVRIDFTAKQKGRGKMVPQEKSYELENGWLTTRDAAVKNETRRQVAPPGQKMDLFELGKGPFPLPLGQDAAAVRAQFEVTIVAATVGDPADTIHLQLKPRPGTKLADRYSTLDVFVDTRRRMPVRIDTADVKGASSTSTVFDNLRVNPPLTDTSFALPPLPGDWHQDVIPMQAAAAARP